jgi:hypothetical protein
VHCRIQYKMQDIPTCIGGSCWLYIWNPVSVIVATKYPYVLTCAFDCGHQADLSYFVSFGSSFNLHSTIKKLHVMRWHQLFLQVGLSQAALRFGCGSVSIQRLDPLVEPGHVPSAHVSRSPRMFEMFTDVAQGASNRWWQCFQRDDDRRHR